MICRPSGHHQLSRVSRGRGIDATIASQLLEAVSGQAVQAAILAGQQAAKVQETVRLAVERELEEARYAADLAERRHEHVDPAKRHVARALEARWNAALERVATVEQKLEQLRAEISAKPAVDPAVLMQLASDLPFVWNAAETDGRARQRLVRLLIEKRAKVGDALRGGISWRCRVAVNSLLRKGYATCQRLPSPN